MMNRWSSRQVQIDLSRQQGYELTLVDRKADPGQSLDVAVCVFEVFDLEYFLTWASPFRAEKCGKEGSPGSAPGQDLEMTDVMGKRPNLAP